MLSGCAEKLAHLHIELITSEKFGEFAKKCYFCTPAYFLYHHLIIIEYEDKTFSFTAFRNNPYAIRRTYSLFFF